MKRAIIIFLSLGSASLILSACGSMIGLSSNDIDPIQETQAHTPTLKETNAGEIESPTAIASDHSTVECSDPFDGVRPGFSTSGWNTNFCLHSVPYSDFLSGGPPRDGIPPIDNPLFEDVASADTWLEDREPVIFLGIGNDNRAYPLQILIWHEIVNDFVNDGPVVVTFCPLCNTALVFKRPVIDGELLTFGTSGNLRNSDLVMWDRQTESWWQQFSGESIVGDLTGQRLEFIPASIISWKDFKNNYSDGSVLSQDTGFARNYGNNPYIGYDDVNESPFLFTGELNDRLPPMTRVLGILSDDGQAISFTLDEIMETRIINSTLGEHEIVIFWKSGTASAVDTGKISDGKDVGTTTVYERLVNGQNLTFTTNGDGTFNDKETNSTWDIHGESIAGKLTGSVLQPIPHHDTFWFAWAAFVPEDAQQE